MALTGNIQSLIILARLYLVGYMTNVLLITNTVAVFYYF